jgi:hypothetical protein
VDGVIGRDGEVFGSDVASMPSGSSSEGIREISGSVNVLRILGTDYRGRTFCHN